jgi:hypothetical protein
LINRTLKILTHYLSTGTEGQWRENQYSNYELSAGTKLQSIVTTIPQNQLKTPNKAWSKKIFLFCLDILDYFLFIQEIVQTKYKDLIFGTASLIKLTKFFKRNNL